MIPVYAILTLASLLLYRHFFIWIMFRDFYESYVVYSFYWLVRYHLGDSIELQIETLKFFYKQELSHKYHSLKEKMANKKLSSSGARRMRAIEDFQARQRLNFLPFLNGLVRVKWMEYDPFSERYSSILRANITERNSIFNTRLFLSLFFPCQLPHQD